MALIYEDLLELTGGFGRYQLFFYFWSILVSLYGCSALAFMVFGGVRPKEIDCTDTVANNSRFVVLSEGNQTWCGHYEFESLVMEWNLIGSQKHVPALITSIQMAGMFLGPLLFGKLADAFGRKKLTILAHLGLAVSGVLCGISTSWQMFAAFRFVHGFFLGGGFTAKYTLFAETTVQRWRLINYLGGPMIGFLYLAFLVAVVTDSWRKVQFYYLLPAAIAIPICILCIAESPKWLLQKRRRKEALAVLKSFARWNKATDLAISELRLQQYQQQKAEIQQLQPQQREGEEEEDRQQQHQQPRPRIQNPSQLSEQPRLQHEQFSNIEEAVDQYRVQEQGSHQFWHMFYHLKTAVQTAALMLSWAVTGAVFYGLLFNVNNVQGSVLINYVILMVIRLFVNCGIVLIDRYSKKLGRRILHQSGMALVAAMMLIMTIFIADDYLRETYPLLARIPALAGVAFAGFLWCAMDVYAAEMFPTTVRAAAYGFMCTSARIGSVIAPQIGLLTSFWGPAPYVVFLALLVSNMVVAFLCLPETKGKPLPDFVDESALKKADNSEALTLDTGRML